MANSTPTQLRFPPVAGFTVRADFEGGALSSDFGPLLLRGVDQQIGLIDRLAGAIDDRRHASYIDHSLSDLLTQRIFQIASGYDDANDANSLRRDPMFKLGVERKPLETEQDLASAPTFSRLENAATTGDLTADAALGNAIDHLALKAAAGNIVGGSTLTADILTLDRSLLLSLSLINVDPDIVAVAPTAVAAACTARTILS